MDIPSQAAAEGGAEYTLIATTALPALLLCGPCGGGKTALYQYLARPAGSGRDALRPTQTSMVANRGAGGCELKGGRTVAFPVVDFPGHPRLQHDLLPEIAAAKAIVVVVDGTAAADLTTGVRPAATLIAKLIEHKDVQGAALVVAVNKRDDITSYSAKAVRKMLEAELTSHFGARSGAVGAAAVGGKAAAAAAGVRQSETGLQLQEGEKFTFDAACALPVHFCDVSAVGPEFSPDAIVEAAFAQ
jgi:signal recognition particle receptor subunit beta